MDLKKLLKLINSKEARRTALVKRSEETEDIAELRSVSSELDTLDEEIRELRGIYEALSGQGTNEEWQDNTENQTAENRSGAQGGFNALGSFNINSNRIENRDEDIYGTLEYRHAFRDYVVNGTQIPDRFRDEQRAAALTTVSDIGAVIPTTILNQVIEDMTVEGKILNRVTQTSYQGGVSIPIAEVLPEATWLADENTTSDEQKAMMEAKVQFGYHVLEAKVAIGLLTSTVALPIFEATVVKQLKAAMIRAIENSIVKGDGSGKPLGIINTEIPNENKITVRADEVGTVLKWAEIEGEIDETVEEYVIYMMSKATWEKYLNGMVDKNGQKIGLGKINEKGKKILNGREVLTVNKFPSFDKAGVGDAFGAVVDLSKYMLNSNLSMYYKKYYDEDKNKWIHKALTIADGKMAIGKDTKKKIVGAQSLILLTKGATLTPAQIKALKKAETELEKTEE